MKKSKIFLTVYMILKINIFVKTKFTINKTNC